MCTNKLVLHKEGTYNTPPTHQPPPNHPPGLLAELRHVLPKELLPLRVIQCLCCRSRTQLLLSAWIYSPSLLLLLVVCCNRCLHSVSDRPPPAAVGRDIQLLQQLPVQLC